jgi:DUF1680 family protein
LIENGYIVLERAWQLGDGVELSLNLEPYLVEAHPRVDAICGSVAIQRGRLAYCLEAVDQPDLNLLDLQVDEAVSLQSIWSEELLTGIIAIQTTGYVAENEAWEGCLYQPLNREEENSRQPVALTVIPYYAWANRGANAMCVWLPWLSMA